MGILDKIKIKRGGSASVQDEVVEDVKTENTDTKKHHHETDHAPTMAVAVHSGVSEVLIAPRVSEKATRIESTGVYTFMVNPKATKVEIKQAVLQQYGVLPTHVRVQHVEGKIASFGRTRGRRSDWKKAVVTLPKGKTITVHEHV